MFFERLTAFLDEWLNIPQDMRNKDGIIENETVIKSCIEMLIKNKVFTMEEMRKEALKSHLIILPYYYFGAGA